jgi:O-antigen ligase
MSRRDARGSIRHGVGSLSPYVIANLILLTLAMLAGGASRENAIPAAIVEFASCLILPWAAFRLADGDGLKPLAWPLAIIALIVLIPVIQLIPLPPNLWTALPGRSQVQAIYAASHIPLPWMSISLTPELTLKTSLALLPSLAVFVGWVGLSSKEQRLGIYLILAIASASLILGAIQLTGGRGVGYLYSNTNLGSLVGFFSNRNHEASLLLCILPLGAALIASARQTKSNVKLAIAAFIILALTVALSLAAVRSRAGVSLYVPALIFSGLLLFRSRVFGNLNRAFLIAAGILLVGLTSLVIFGLAPLMARFDGNLVQEERLVVAPDILHAAIQHLPFGTGLGSFDLAYRSIERLDNVSATFLNHAHDDFLEIALECGLLGLLPGLCFLGWLGRRSWQAWSGSEGRSSQMMAQAGVIVIGLLLAHSVLDYPLRTAALSSVFAFACALLNRREPI